jgi:hypothetical protein
MGSGHTAVSGNRGYAQAPAEPMLSAAQGSSFSNGLFRTDQDGKQYYGDEEDANGEEE